MLLLIYIGLILLSLFSRRLARKLEVKADRAVAGFGVSPAQYANTRMKADRYLRSGQESSDWTAWVDEMIKACPAEPNEIYRLEVRSALESLVE